MNQNKCEARRSHCEIIYRRSLDIDTVQVNAVQQRDREQGEIRGAPAPDIFAGKVMSPSRMFLPICPGECLITCSVEEKYATHHSSGIGVTFYYLISF